MISIIICSRTRTISKELASNISDTIGCAYELVIIDNSRNQYNIFSAYNEGIRRANGNILCFMHDDILYKTIDWGKKVNCLYKENENIGVVGVLGSHYLTSKEGYWDMMQPYTTGCVYVDNWNKVVNWNLCSNVNEVVVVDGMWFCIPKKLFEKIAFDEKTFHGFHFYDADISMQSLCVGYKNIVIRDIDICHNCHVDYNESFLKNMRLFFKKWNHMLPISRGIEVEERIAISIEAYVQRLCYEMDRKVHYLKNFNSVFNSYAFHIGSFFMYPIYFIKKITSK